MTSDDRLNAIGNDLADKIAKDQASLLPRPSEAEQQDWEKQQSFLRNYFRFLPAALMQWPSASPSQGHKSLPKRAADDQPTDRASFLTDLLGPWREDDNKVEPQAGKPPSSTDPIPTRDGGRQVEPDAVERTPREAVPLGASRTKETNAHRVKGQEGRWICTNCLATSRTAIPRQIFKCPGLASNIRDLLHRPQGHRLQVATFTSGAGLVVICSACGRFTTSNRRGVLHKEPCPASSGQASFQSDGARFAYKRVCEGKHPAYKHGDSKVLKACTLPLTGAGVVDRIITNLGVLDVVEGGLKIVDLAEGVTEEDMRAATEATIL